MRKSNNTPAKAQGAEAGTKKKFDLREIGFTDLDGNRRAMIFDNKEFGNLLFVNAQTIEMDRVAKNIHLDGKTEATNDVLQELDSIIQLASNYNHRARTAITEYISNLIGGK